MTVAYWIALRPIFEVCANETVYKGGGRLWEPWWWQVAAEKQLRFTLEEILAAERERRKRESGRSGRGKGDEGDSDYESYG